MNADEFHQQQLEQQQWESFQQKLAPVYCDKIADMIRSALNKYDSDWLIAGCGSIKFDLNADGSLASTKKTLFAIDRVGRQYKITVEEV